MNQHDNISLEMYKALRIASLRMLANRSVLRHLLDVLVCIFNFQFIAALGSFAWAIEKAFKIGDYNPNGGFFYKEGALEKLPVPKKPAN